MNKHLLENLIAFIAFVAFVHFGFKPGCARIMLASQMKLSGYDPTDEQLRATMLVRRSLMYALLAFGFAYSLADSEIRLWVSVLAALLAGVTAFAIYSLFPRLQD